jgi:hypothetical protein
MTEFAGGMITKLTKATKEKMDYRIASGALAMGRPPPIGHPYRWTGIAHRSQSVPPPRKSRPRARGNRNQFFVIFAAFVVFVILNHSTRGPRQVSCASKG